ncbi:MAG TPA: glycosyltransferase [Rectinemataceae bacterium]|nr:glycosyltransferase [Rectinemataceae bacterium]
MSDPIVSVVVPYRDRDLSRVEALLSSLRLHTKTPFEFIVSDYGSRDDYRSKLDALRGRMEFRVARSEARGLPWNRSHAINNGVRVAQGRLVVISDVDMVFHDPVVDHLAGTIKEDEAWFLESIWPQRPNANPLKGVRNRSAGVFQMLHRAWFERLDGFCEDFEFWGAEDIDWLGRLERAGCRINWLTADQFRLTHSWHPWENNAVKRPFSAVADALKIEVRNGWQPYRNPDWGRLLTLDDRPILRAEGAEAECEMVVPGRHAWQWVAEAKRLLESGRRLRFELGPRMPRRALTRWSAGPLALQYLFNRFSLRIEYLINGSLESILMLRDVLGRENVDISIGDDQERVVMVMRKTRVGN